MKNSFVVPITPENYVGLSTVEFINSYPDNIDNEMHDDNAIPGDTQEQLILVQY